MAASSDLADKFSLPLIRKLYAEHLGIEESDNNTSWESMGGDSIQALDLLDELNTKSPSPFTLAEFMQLDTPEALYRFITEIRLPPNHRSRSARWLWLRWFYFTRLVEIS
ncbi:acyl carrier protein [Arsenophonus endosymbiont of Aleurodicus floccissimus]|uniref:acyl carrier protein n=1 Tax=Arsenophonus endosymbiont of Aleurodicus floccissimus TaxID=2152761 RepID=UPI000E6B25DD|nr:acyl carrier protein [Arsenophonus endosymbiont of Aleurodicus floccissimus]